MAEKKTSTRKKTSSSSSRSTSKSKKTSTGKTSTRAARPVEEELEDSPRGGSFWGVFLLALGIFMIISYFSTEGKFVAFFAKLVKGLVGWGFWLTVPVFLFAGLILLMRKEKPVGHRVFCALLLPPG